MASRGLAFGTIQIVIGCNHIVNVHEGLTLIRQSTFPWPNLSPWLERALIGMADGVIMPPAHTVTLIT